MYRNLKILHCMNNDLELPKEYKSLIDINHGDSMLKLKQALKDLEKETDEEKKVALIKTLNDKFFGYTFINSRAAAGERARGESVSSSKERSSKISKWVKEFFNFENILEKYYNTSYEVHSFNQVGEGKYTRIDIKKLKKPKSRINLLGVLENYTHIQNLGELFSTIKKEMEEEFKKQKYIFSLRNDFIGKMNTNELEEVAEALGITDSFDVVHRMFTLEFTDQIKKIKNFQSNEKLEKNLKEFKELIQERKDLVDFDRILDKCLLKISLEKGNPEADLLEKLIQNPTQSFRSYIYSEERQKNLEKFIPCPVPQRWQTELNWFIGSTQDVTLIQDCIKEIIRTEEILNRFSKYFNAETLKKHLVSYLTLQGGPISIEAYQEVFGNNAAENLSNEKILKLMENNKDNFNNGESAQIELMIKNIDTLEVKIFSVDIVNYYKEFKNSPSHSMDLDGLLPQKSITYTYKNPKHQQHLEKFKFDEIDSSNFGYYFIDFIGGGLMSRVVVEKGSLSLIENQSEHGVNFYILDHHKNVCIGNNTGIYIEGKFLPVDGNGAVQIPFEERSRSVEAILIHGDFAFMKRVYIPEERYELKNSIAFNEEGFLPGRKAKILLRSRLFLHNSSVSLKKLKNVVINLSTSTNDGILNNKTFPNVELSDDKDYLISFMVPNNLSSVSISLQSKLETVAKGEISLNYYNSDIRLKRNEGTDYIQTGFLRHENGEYFFDLKGKNGEGIPGKQVSFTFKRIYDDDSTNESIFTDKEGVVQLGNLEGVKTIEACYEGNSTLHKIYRNDVSSDIPSNYRVCEGEDLVLPSLGAKSGEIFLRNASLGLDVTTEHVKFENDGENFSLSGLKEGTYSLRYLTEINKKLYVDVIKGERWQGGTLISTENSLLEVKNELKFLDFKKIENQDKKLKISLSSNSMETAYIHVMGYHHQPMHVYYTHEKMSGLGVSGSPKEFNIEQSKNFYASGKKLGDEVKYVLDRVNKKTFIGNTLKKPSILLHRKFIKETEEEEEKLEATKDFDQFYEGGGGGGGGGGGRRMRSMANKKKRKAKRKIQDFRRDFNLQTDYEYINDSGKILENLKPDEDGEIEVDLLEFEKYSEIVIMACDNFSQAMKTVNLRAPDYKKNDLRLKEAKEAGVIYTEDRFCLASKNQTQVVLEDMKTTQYALIEDLEGLRSSLGIISSVNKMELNKLSFLTKWNELSKEEKLKKMEEFGGHEMNVFCYVKDRQFFDEEIAPILRFKSEKELIDHILTRNLKVMEEAFALEGISSLNALELVLLVDYYKESKKELCEKILESLKQRLSMVKQNEEKRNSNYDSILASKKQEEEMKKQKEMERREKEEVMHMRKEMEMEEMRKCEEEVRYMARQDEQSRPQMKRRSKKSRAMKSMAISGEIQRMISPTSNKVEIRRYKKTGAAFEYGERHKYFNSEPQKNHFNKFWLEIIESLVTSSNLTILSENFMDCISQNYLTFYALTFFDLPFTAGDLQTETTDKSLKLSSTENILLICKKMEEKKTDQLKMDLIISQKFYDPKEKYRYNEEDPDIKTIKEIDQFLVGKVYQSQIIFTNISENHLRVKLIQQIPEGSLPVNELKFLKINDVNLGSYSTKIIEFKFYFPSEGEFSCYPATISKNNKMVAFADISKKMKVVKKLERGDKPLESLQDILKFGSEEDILKFMQEKNIYNSNLFNVSQILWILKEKKHYLKAVEILRSKCFFDHRVWGYSILHGDLRGFKELTKNKVSLFGHYPNNWKFFENEYLHVDRFKPLEYDPLINPRAHNLSEKRENIRNKVFKQTYENFLDYCIERPSLSSREQIILTAYLTLQDRIEEALKLVKKIDEDDIKKNQTMVVQFDYLKAYLSIYEEYPKFDTARVISGKYDNFSDLSWRKMFKEIKNQLNEFDGHETEQEEEETENMIKHASNKDLVETAEYLKIELKDDKSKIGVTFMNIDQLRVSFFKLNLEMLFTKDAFLEKNMKNFSFVNPNLRQIVNLQATNKGDFNSTVVTVPTELSSSALFIHIQGGSQNKTLKIFNSKLNAHAIEDFGMMKVKSEDGKLLNSIYVKCYYKDKSGNVKFYKDGYTDFRGSFDYASLNSNSLDRVDKFSILITSPEYGSVVVEAKPPSKVGTIRG